jgi:hypothetical protein
MGQSGEPAPLPGGMAVVKYGHLIAIMGTVNRTRQDTASVLGFFGQNAAQCRRFVEKGISRGKRPDLVGGGLIRLPGVGRRWRK